jgi:hypothetical protein
MNTSASIWSERPEGCVYPDSLCGWVILENQRAESIDADDYTVILIPGSSRLRRLKGQATVRCEKSWRLLS